MRIRQTEILLGAGLLVILLVANAAVGYRSTLELRDGAGEVARRYEIIDGLDELLSAVQDAETGQRGYLITGEEKYLEPYARASKVIDEKVQRIIRLTKDDSSQHDRLDRLRRRQSQARRAVAHR